LVENNTRKALSDSVPFFVRSFRRGKDCLTGVKLLLCEERLQKNCELVLKRNGRKEENFGKQYKKRRKSVLFVVKLFAGKS